MYEDDEGERSERKLLKRELRAQALARLEDSARTVTDFKYEYISDILYGLN